MPVNPSRSSGDPDHTRSPTGARARRTQAERSAATRSALIDAGRALFAEQGYVGTAREEICRRAGVTRGALDHHFDGKKGLFRAVVEAVEQSVGERIATAALRHTDPMERFRAGCSTYLDLADDPEVRRIVLRDARAVLGWSEWEEIQATHGLGLTVGAIQELVDEGAIPPRAVELTARILLAALNEAVLAIAVADDPATVRRQARDEIDRLLAGLFA